MDTKLESILKKINYKNDYFVEFIDAKVDRVNANGSKLDIVIHNKTNLTTEAYNELEKSFKDFFNIEEIYLYIIVDEIDNDKLLNEYKNIIGLLKKEKSLLEIFEDSLAFEEEKYLIKAAHEFEKATIEKYIPRITEYLEKRGFDIDIDVVLSLEERENIKNTINNDLEIKIPTTKVIKQEEKAPTKTNFTNFGKPKYEKKEVNEDTIKGRVIKDDAVSIKTIVGEEESVTIEGEVFGTEEFEPSSKAFKILTIKLTDYSDSIYCKIFSRDEEEFASLKKNCKVGAWLKIRGSTKLDKYAGNEIVLNIRDINKIPPKRTKKIVDDAPVKRVELHAHTMMSQMDGVTKLDLGKHTCELVSNAIEAGYRGVAITDHNGCQAFPISYQLIRAHNKKIENVKDHFKGLYGTELTLVDDTVYVVVRPNDLPLEGTTYVVFDTETTGFNAAGGDQMIEIGAVKLKDGEIIDRFDELINPGYHIPDHISELTCITDDMVKDSDTEEEVTKRFLSWVGDCPLVAHNAKFDISFISMAMKKYNLGEFNYTVLDTLELSHILDQAYARHSLSALVKRYNVPWEEDAHHRADYDAEGTAYVFAKMLQKLIAQNYDTIRDLERLIPKDEIHKFGRTYHFNAIAMNKTGLKNLFKIISLANTVYLYKTPRILRSKLEELREGLLIGSGCYESEVFIQSRSKEGEELTNVINFYDYVEVQPPEVYGHLIQTSDFKNEYEVQAHISKIVRATKDAGKIIVATGDVHHFYREDKIFREIIVNQKVPGGGRHPLAKRDITSIPSQHFRTTNEMLKDFEFLGKDLAYEIVVTNTNKVLDMVDEIEVIIDTKGIPFSPRVKSDDGASYLDCPRVVADLVYSKAASWYGNPLPYNIEERIAKELYGDIVYKCFSDKVSEEDKDISKEEFDKKVFGMVHDAIIAGFDNVKEILREYLKSKWTEEDGELNDDSLNKKVKKELGGIIGGGFDPIYLIAQRLVKHSNDDGYLVGSRGSVGSSFVATMMGITEVNPLPAHYRCLNCQTSIFNDDNGNPLGSEYSSGFDLPDKKCPKCGSLMYKDGQDMPFATFLGFNADKVPDIDLNFSDLNQASAHEYTKVLFGVDNVYRAGTIGTVADKTAFGYVKGYCEDKNVMMRTAEVERLAAGCTGVKRTTGQHPGGIVVVPDYMDVSDFTPFQFPADDPTSPWRTTHFDYHSIEEDLLKLDILGHSDPTQLRMIQDLTKTDILKVPMDDKDTMSIFTSTKALGVTNEQIMCPTGTLGIPEFGTPFTISMVSETKPTTFAELIKISGLSHGTDVWLGNAQELIKNNIVPFKEVIGCRDDIMVYLMYHGVAPIKAFKIMEFVRKGRASKDPETWQTHRKTMEEAGIEPWFIDSCQKIKYMFPKAHAAAYVISAFRIAWYKVHMPVYFYASWLTSKATDVDVETMIKGYDAIKSKIEDIQLKGYEATNKEQGILESLKVCLEATARGIKFVPIELDKSNATVWNVKDETSIYPPFASIDGLGDTVANNIVNERQKQKFLSIEDLQNRCKISATLIDKMKSMKILDGMDESSQLSLF
ncbi:MAG: PolC-type DNA polymerase III [Bacilli bacterium]|nr:PolC-type DNA polymerase III [Bacilli bacterium]